MTDPYQQHRQLDKRTVRRHFDRAAAGYDNAAVLQREVCRRMLERLDYMRLQPGSILDLGCGTGLCQAGLSQCFPGARMLAMDLSHAMLRALRRKLPWYRRFYRPVRLIVGDAEAIPLPDQSVDIVFSNLTVQWCNDLGRVFAEMRRVLKPGGMLLFSTFGPDTLHELRDSWAQVDGRGHVSGFLDLHDVGDALLHAGLAEPVMDAERFTLTYTQVMDLLRDLKHIGATNALSQRQKGLMGKQAWRAMEDAYESRRHAGKLPATYEVIYGHAWAPAHPRGVQTPVQHEIPLQSLRRP